jgi:sec-independent protein translocase protein TatA
MFGLGPTELIIIAIIVLLIFGAKRLPDIGKGLGGAIKEFRNVKKELSSDKTNDNSDNKDEKENVIETNDTSQTLEAKVTNKVLEQVPGVKKVMDVKKKADALKNLLK